MKCSVYIVCPSVLSCCNLKLHQMWEVKNIFKQENIMRQLTFNPGLTLTGFRTTRPWCTVHHLSILLYTKLTISALVTSSSCRLHNNHVKALEVTGNHLMYDGGGWFLIMSSSRAFCCLLSAKKQKRNFYVFLRSMYNETIIRFDFCDTQNNQGVGKVYRQATN